MPYPPFASFASLEIFVVQILDGRNSSHLVTPEVPSQLKYRQFVSLHYE